MEAQKQKTNPPPEDLKKKNSGSAPKTDERLSKAVAEAKDLSARLDKAATKKSGRWEHCCGVRIWVED